MKLLNALTSQVGRKILTGLTGLALLLFVVVHLAGNLTLLCQDSSHFNLYAKKLESMGVLLYIAEIGLIATFALHGVVALLIRKQGREATGTPYDVDASAGGRSKKSLSSTTMAISGAVLLLFVVIHVAQFKYGVFDKNPIEYVNIDGKEVKDLYGRVEAAFSNFFVVFFYCVVMVMLGSHLRHGIWSACQSLGLNRKSTSDDLYKLGTALAILLTIGFISIPVIMFIRSLSGS